jgi:hypothetical protein
MTSAAKIDANRRNAKKSTGPRTDEGKSRSRFNALKHGMAARLPVLPGEDVAKFHSELHGWLDTFRPRTPVERYQVERAHQLSWQLDRLWRANTARISVRILTHRADQQKSEHDEAADLGRRLLWDPRGHLTLYPHSDEPAGPVPVYWSENPDDPNDPDCLVGRLEATRAGCRWLKERWDELRATVDRQLGWSAPERFKAFRLLGKQPLDALCNNELATIMQACHVLDPEAGDPYDDVWHDLLPAQAGPAKDRLRARGIERLRPADGAAARQALIGIVDREATRLTALARRHRRRSVIEAEYAANRLAFDDTPGGQRLHRFESSCQRVMFRMIDTFLQARREERRVGGLEPRGDRFGMAPPARYATRFDSIDLTRSDDSFDHFDFREAGMTGVHVAESPAAPHADGEDSIAQIEPIAAKPEQPMFATETPGAGLATPQTETTLYTSDLHPETASAAGASVLADRVANAARRILQNEPTAAVFSGPHRAGRHAPVRNRAARRRDRARRSATARREIDMLIAPAAVPAASAGVLAGVSLT